MRTPFRGGGIGSARLGLEEAYLVDIRAAKTVHESRRGTRILVLWWKSRVVGNTRSWWKRTSIGHPQTTEYSKAKSGTRWRTRILNYRLRLVLARHSPVGSCQ